MAKERPNAPVSVRLAPGQRAALRAIAKADFGGNESRAVVWAIQAVYAPMMAATLKEISETNGWGLKADILRDGVGILTRAIEAIDYQAELRADLAKRLDDLLAGLEKAIAKLKV